MTSSDIYATILPFLKVRKMIDYGNIHRVHAHQILTITFPVVQVMNLSFRASFIRRFRPLVTYVAVTSLVTLTAKSETG